MLIRAVFDFVYGLFLAKVSFSYPHLPEIQAQKKTAWQWIPAVFPKV
ncbi:hypothetical protein ACPPVU_10360 [Mucilaginibacter sp. McL0603]